MATRGDTVPGIGRIDSIVCWGNRWIVATASGLIATRKGEIFAMQKVSNRAGQPASTLSSRDLLPRMVS
jgi:hypothetical protein